MYNIALAQKVKAQRVIGLLNSKIIHTLAQRKSGRPINHGSPDRNLALIIFLFFLSQLFPPINFMYLVLTFCYLMRLPLPFHVFFDRIQRWTCINELKDGQI